MPPLESTYFYHKKEAGKEEKEEKEESEGIKIPDMI